MRNLQMSVRSIDDVSWILEAAQDTINATEKDFDTIRSKKWYKRLWETVTFSKDNQIQMAKGVSNLAKLQEIIIKLLVVLSQDSVEISKVVQQNSELILRLSVTDALLSKQIDKIKYGGTAQIDFDSLGGDNKALIANLLIMADPTAQRNEYSRQYISSVMRGAKLTAVDNTVKVDAVEQLNRMEQELLYRMIMIDRYLLNIDFDSPSEIIDWISVNLKRKKEIRSEVQMTADAVTPEFFATYYEKSSDTYDEITDDDIWFECDEQQTDIPDGESLDEDVETVQPSEYQDVVLSSILHIPENQTCRFENKILYVRTIVDCEGTLELSNCTIHYFDTDSVSEIKVKETGVVCADNCTFICHACRTKEFIFAEAGSERIVINGGKFVNCCSLLRSKRSVLFDHCEVINPGGNFIKIETYSDANVVVTNTNFLFDTVPGFLTDCKDAIISGPDIVFSENTVTGELIIDSAERAKSETDERCWRAYFIDAGKISVSNVRFKGVRKIIRYNHWYNDGASTIFHSSFEHCLDIITTAGFCGNLELKECEFTQCTQVASWIGGHNRFLHCRFFNCFNELVSSNITGGTVLDYCEFRKWSAWKRDTSSAVVRHSLEFFSHAMLDFDRAKGEKYHINKVSNCVFDGITAHQFFVIKGDVHENIGGYVAKVENCSFLNCTTEQSSGRIIKEYNYYLGLFNKRKDVKTVDIASDCRGLDQVRKM